MTRPPKSPIQPTPGSEDAWELYRRSGQYLPELEIDPRERQQWQRQVRGVKTRQAAIACWLIGTPLVVMAFLFGGGSWWAIAAIATAIGAVVGYLLPVNVPPPRRPSLGGNSPYGVYDPRGPHAPRN